MARKKTGSSPVTRVAKEQPTIGTDEWIIWAAWADRITFEEIEKQTGLGENEVIRFMRSNQTASSFRRWRRRVAGRSTKHLTRFKNRRRDGQWNHPEATD